MQFLVESNKGSVLIAPWYKWQQVKWQSTQSLTRRTKERAKKSPSRIIANPRHWEGCTCTWSDTYSGVALTIGYNIPYRFYIIKMRDIWVDEYVEKLESLNVIGGDVKYFSHFEHNLAVPPKCHPSKCWHKVPKWSSNFTPNCISKSNEKTTTHMLTKKLEQQHYSQ